ncbi:hypothetical protein E4U13_006922, partial [Claviceps humidiphila]
FSGEILAPCRTPFPQAWPCALQQRQLRLQSQGHTLTLGSVRVVTRLNLRLCIRPPTEACKIIEAKATKMMKN